jgi:ATP-binding cassette, subfamily F, member 3
MWRKKARRKQLTDEERAEEARRAAEREAKASKARAEADAKAQKALEWAEGAARREAEAEAKKKKRRLTPAELQKRLDEVEMHIREQDAMLGYIDQQISIPENQMDLELSKSLAAEREETAAKLDRYMQQWEELLEQQDEQEDEETPES